MPKFTVCLSQDVVVYATIEVEAEDASEAEEIALGSVQEDDFEIGDFFPDPEISWVEEANEEDEED